MSRRNRSNDPRDLRDPRGSDRPAPASSLPPGALGIVTVIGVAALVLVNLKLLGDTHKLQTTLDELGQRVGSVSTKVDNYAAKAAQAAQPPRPQGPDPNKVYQVKTQGAPAEGPESAPVVIAEFSDFQ